MGGGGGGGGGDDNNHNNDDYNNNDDDDDNNHNNDDNSDSKQRRQQQHQQDLSLCAVRQQSLLCVCNDFLGTRALSCALCGTDAPPYRTLFGKTAVVAVCSQ